MAILFLNIDLLRHEIVFFKTFSSIDKWKYVIENKDYNQTMSVTKMDGNEKRDFLLTNKMVFLKNMCS